MRILFTSIRGSGHFNPLVPLARGLADRGHEVRFAGIPELGERVSASGFEHLVFDGPTDAERAGIDAMIKTMEPSKVGKWFVPNVFMGILARPAVPGLVGHIENWRPDLIVRETCEFAGLVAAEVTGTPSVRIEVLNGESEESIATNYGPAMDALRLHAGLAPDGGARLRAEATFSAHPAVLDDTPRVNSRAPLRYRTRPPDVVEAAPGDWYPGADIPFVYATFGTVLSGVDHIAPMFAAAVEALGRLPVNALLTVGRDAPENLIPGPVPGNVELRDFVPQAEVLPHADLMVCHGGSGTVLGGLEAGVPLVIAPVAADQPDNARCLAAAGLAQVVDDVVGDGSAERIAAAIDAALADTGLRSRAAAAARDIAAMAHLEEALDVMETHAAVQNRVPSG